jgi:hypothetical protein
MNSNPARSYRCKDEELPVIGEYVSYGLKRDIIDFSAYSPKFSEGYISDFDGKIAAANELVNPIMGTADLTTTTTRLYATMDGLLGTTRRIDGYLKLAKSSVPVSPAKFGLTELRKRLHTKDAEGVLRNLQLVMANIKKFREPLAAEGLTEEFEAQLATAHDTVAQDNKRQFEIVSERKALVQDNLEAFNSLYAQLAEICEVGKILFKTAKPERAQEYTFAYLLKKVRVVHKKQDAGQTTAEEGVQ